MSLPPTGDGAVDKAGRESTWLFASAVNRTCESVDFTFSFGSLCCLGSPSGGWGDGVREDEDIPATLHSEWSPAPSASAPDKTAPRALLPPFMIMFGIHYGAK